MNKHVSPHAKGAALTTADCFALISWCVQNTALTAEVLQHDHAMEFDPEFFQALAGLQLYLDRQIHKEKKLSRPLTAMSKMPPVPTLREFLSKPPKRVSPAKP